MITLCQVKGRSPPSHTYHNAFTFYGRSAHRCLKYGGKPGCAIGVPLTARTSIALPSFLAHLAEPFLERTRKQQQQLILQLPETLPSPTTDRAYLERILTELLQNACKYTPAGATITLSAHVTITTLTICVSNSGTEIPAIEYDRIFDKFYRIPNNDPWKHGVTGLGLTLVQKLTERLGAAIHVASSDNQTTFTLKFLGVV